MAAGHDVLKAAVVPDDPNEKVKLLAVTLLARSILNFDGAIRMARVQLVVEARILVRSCFENQFWIAGLKAEGDRFAERMLHDEIKSRQGRGQFLFENDRTRSSLPPDTSQRLRDWIEESRKQWPKAASLKPKAVAAGTVAAAAYVLYAQLSSDSAHPSLYALGRHIVTQSADDQTIRGIDVRPVVRPREIEDTLDLACMALLGAIIGANDVLGGTAGDLALNDLTREYQRLSGIDAAADERPADQSG